MEIGFFISELLIQHNEVSLSGFGTFCKNNKARFNPDDRKFYPPANRLSFKNGEGDNSLLIQYISRIKNISEASAEYFTGKFVKELKQELEENNRAEILPLGEIEKSGAGYILKQVAEIERTQYYGLVPVQELLPKSDFRFSRTERSQIDEEAPVLYMSPSSTELEQEDTRSSYSWIKILVTLAICIIIGASGYVWYKQYLSKEISSAPYVDSSILPHTDDLKGIAPAPPLNDSVRPDTIHTTPETKRNVTGAADTAAKSLITVAPHEAMTFEIVAAAFGTEKEAADYISLLAKKGIDAKVVGNSKRNLKISIGSYNDKASAAKALAEARKNFNANAWIYEWKPKN